MPEVKDPICDIWCGYCKKWFRVDDKRQFVEDHMGECEKELIANIRKNKH